MDNFDRIKSLVCRRCWTDVFCSADFGGPGPIIQQVVTLAQVQASAGIGCSWCSLLVSYLVNVKKDDPKAITFTITLERTNLSSSSTLSPSGYDRYSFELRGLSWGLFGSFGAYAHPKSNASKSVKVRPPLGEVESPTVYAQIHRWLKECDEHSACPSQVEIPLPTRVIEVSPRSSPDKPRVICPGDRDGRYAALSYCWGGSRSCQLTTENINVYNQGLEFSALPSTIRDAIVVARSISLPYLWIDALCILQDSEDDKTKEIAQMDKIYRNATVTIVASCASDTNVGFLHTRKMPSVFEVPYTIHNGLFSSVLLQPTTKMAYKEDTEPINKRAWTLQEQLLAPRVLNYASDTLTWRCRAGPKSLGGVSRITAPGEFLLTELCRPILDADSALSQWYMLISRYSHRQMSFENDKLPALAGIAHNYARHLGPGYHAGLWQYELHRQLLWRRRGYWKHGRPENYPSYHLKPPAQYRAPSWSWASLDGPIVINEHNLNDSQTTGYEVQYAPDHFGRLCDIRFVQVTRKSSLSQYGEVVGGHLVLGTVSRSAWVMSPSDRGDTIYTGVLTDEIGSAVDEVKNTHGTPDLHCVLDVYTENETPVSVTCIALTMSHGMDNRKLLWGLALAPAQNRKFKRVGMFWSDVPGLWEREFKGQPYKEFTII